MSVFGGRATMVRRNPKALW